MKVDQQAKSVEVVEDKGDKEIISCAKVTMVSDTTIGATLLEFRDIYHKMISSKYLIWIIQLKSKRILLSKLTMASIIVSILGIRIITNITQRYQ